MMYPLPVDREKLAEFSKTDEIGKGGSLGQAENWCFILFQSLSRGLITSEYFFLNFDMFILNVNKKQIGYTACSITL